MFAPSLTLEISGSVDVSQLFGRTIYSEESNFTISLGETVNKYFQRYPSFPAPAEKGAKSVDVGSKLDLPPVGLLADDPLSIQT